MKKSTKYESAVNLPIYIAKVNGIARYSPHLCKFVSHNKKNFMRNDFSHDSPNFAEK